MAQNEENKGILHRGKRQDIASRSIGFNAGNFSLKSYKLIFNNTTNKSCDSVPGSES